MPEYLAPGVYVEEVSSGNKPIAGVSTSTAGFVGPAARGPLSPQYITSWLAFQRWYGGYIDDSFLAYAVEGFFVNGGQRCFISRIVGDSAFAAQATIDGDKLNVVAVGPGEWGNSVEVTIKTPSLAENLGDLDPQDLTNKQKEIMRWVKIIVTYKDVTEVHDNLSLQEGASNNIVTTINSSSKLIRVWLKDELPANEQLAQSDATQLAGGKNRAADLVVGDFVGHQNPIPLPTDAPEELLGIGTGLKALELIDEISLLIVPDQATDGLFSVLTAEVVNQCILLKDRFAIISSRPGKSTINQLCPPLDTSFAGFYYPWIKIYDPLTNYTKKIPAVGHIAGIFARTDIERGVHKAPANEVVRRALDLEFPITKTMQDLLNPRGVNCMRDFRSDGRGLRLWGARTMSSDPEWRYVNVRRLFLFVEESIDEGTQWVVFEPNDDSTWAKVRRNITNFLISVWRSGALMGLTPDEAFFVACDRTTMTQDDIDNGRLICVVGIAPVKPAEFVIFRISQKTSDSAG